MPTDVENEVLSLPQLTIGQLRERYAELFGEQCRTFHKVHLIRKIAWRLQALAEGDLTERARHRAAELAREADVRVTTPKWFGNSAPVSVNGPKVTARFAADPRVPIPGTVLVRRYKDRDIQVTVHPDGFEFDGRRFKTLTAIAKEVTGTHCNGFRFFQLGSTT